MSTKAARDILYILIWKCLNIFSELVRVYVLVVDVTFIRLNENKAEVAGGDKE